MRVLKWSLIFALKLNHQKHHSRFPCQISLCFYSKKRCLFSIGQLIGSPLTLDMATTNLSRPSVARLCMEVEVNLLTKLPKHIWLVCGDAIPGYWHEIEYEILPAYCKHCKRLGHDIHVCMLAHPHLEKPTYAQGQQKVAEKEIYPKKQQQVTEEEAHICIMKIRKKKHLKKNKKTIMSKMKRYLPQIKMPRSPSNSHMFRKRYK